MGEKGKYLLLAAASAVLLSVPFLVPFAGWVALVALVPLLWLERIYKGKRFWWWHYGTFVLWNALTTFWVCNATVGGGIFAVLANALQMSVVFALFRWSRRRFSGSVPYIFLALAWIAWERWYFGTQISWPWLTLGHAFAQSTGLVQWYEFTGTLGGSLWVWAANLSVFGLICALREGFWHEWNVKAKSAAIAGTVTVILAPMAVSAAIYSSFEEEGTPREVAIVQPNFDPYQKFQSMSQAGQNAIFLDLAAKALKDRKGDSTAAPLLLLAPETFTGDVVTNDIPSGATFRRFHGFLQDYPGVDVIFGASAWTRIDSSERPSRTARKIDDGQWVESHNSALVTDASGRYEIFHKSKLVVGTELTPYPAIFVPIDDALGGVMGRCVGQDEISCLHLGDGTPIGCAICYESVYGEYCTGYVRKGAQALCVITNDAWWGDTPGYRQHLSYSRLRAIETRRDIARCANTGISAIIDQRGRIVSQTPWWEPATLRGEIHLRDGQTFFVRNGDIVGRLCSFLFLLLLLALLVRTLRGDYSK